jgi:hypothetical protein
MLHDIKHSILCFVCYVMELGCFEAITMAWVGGASLVETCLSRELSQHMLTPGSHNSYITKPTFGHYLTSVSFGISSYPSIHVQSFKISCSHKGV